MFYNKGGRRGWCSLVTPKSDICCFRNHVVFYLVLELKKRHEEVKYTDVGGLRQPYLWPLKIFLRHCFVTLLIVELGPFWISWKYWEKIYPDVTWQETNRIPLKVYPLSPSIWSRCLLNLWQSIFREFRTQLLEKERIWTSFIFYVTTQSIWIPFDFTFTFW